MPGRALDAARDDRQSAGHAGAHVRDAHGEEGAVGVGLASEGIDLVDRGDGGERLDAIDQRERQHDGEEAPPDRRVGHHAMEIRQRHAVLERVIGEVNQVLRVQPQELAHDQPEDGREHLRRHDFQPFCLE